MISSNSFLNVTSSSLEMFSFILPSIACSKTCITSLWSSVLAKSCLFMSSFSWFLSRSSIFVMLLAPVTIQVVKVVMTAVAAKFFQCQSEVRFVPHCSFAHWFARFPAANWTASWMFSVNISFPIVWVKSFPTCRIDCLDPFLQSSLINPFATLLPFPSKISFGLMSSSPPCNPEERKL